MPSSNPINQHAGKTRRAELADYIAEMEDQGTPVTRADLSRHFDLSDKQVSKHVNRMLADGLVREGQVIGRSRQLVLA